jgi:hypothetical protein
MKFLSLALILFSFSAPTFAAEVPIDVSGASTPHSADCGGAEALKNARDNYQSQCENNERDLGCSSCDTPSFGSPVIEHTASTGDYGCKSTISASGEAHGCTAQ